LLLWRCSQAAYELILAGSTQWVYHLSVGLNFVSVRTNKRCYHRIVCSDTDDEFHERKRGEHDSASPRFDLLGIVTAYMAKTFRASASTSAKEANARSAGARASASTSAEGANARSAGGGFCQHQRQRNTCKVRGGESERGKRERERSEREKREISFLDDHEVTEGR